jgi:hypothetical protein
MRHLGVKKNLNKENSSVMSRDPVPRAEISYDKQGFIDENKETVRNISKFSWGHRNRRHAFGVPETGKE